MLRTAFGIALLNRTAARAALSSQSSWIGAAVVVTVVGVATASPSIVDGRFSDALPQLAMAFSGWLVLGALVTSLGNWAFAHEGRRAGWGPLTRAIGLAQAPGLLRAFGVIDSAGLAVSIIVFVWQAVAVSAVIREAFGFQKRVSAIALWAVALIPFLAIQVGLQLFLTQ
jgi:hypothetical protein